MLCADIQNETFCQEMDFQNFTGKKNLYTLKNNVLNRSFIDSQLFFMYALHFSACWEFCYYMGKTNMLNIFFFSDFNFCYYFFWFGFKILLNFCKRSQANAFILSLSCIDLLAGFTGKVGAYRQQPGYMKF